MSLVAGTRLGPYEIQAAIGAGGMGEVYKARDTRLDRTVAIKVLAAELSADPDRRMRFEREARAIAALSHPHTCTLHDIGTHFWPGVVFYAGSVGFASAPGSVCKTSILRFKSGRRVQFPKVRLRRRGQYANQKRQRSPQGDR